MWLARPVTAITLTPSNEVSTLSNSAPLSLHFLIERFCLGNKADWLLAAR